ncbi:SDR family NAD(P)-dependent oxidoreductase [Hamadaea sp. NPDC050747]|uniref:SDR family NAD(P)-dependent oxidoreductase n=1 Tax=Hamadaea sp. NPDC050747 TaxID=3155789 RepID=UPI0033FF56FC
MSEFFDPIAIVGISARLPGARDITEYWNNLVAGQESITALTDDELRAAGVPRSLRDDPAYVKMAGLAPDVDHFDAGFFGMTAREADICDPQLRLFLEVAYQAIEDAGYDPVRMSRDVAVYGACGQNRYGDLHVMENPKYSADADMGIMVLNSVDYLATLVSYKLNFRGPSMSVLTACSSSLTAVHLACQALQLGECDAAIAAASNVEIPYRTGYRWSPGGVRSADGRCRPFDASGTGTIFTNGAGAVLLKRAADAIADGDHIWGVIHGVGVNNDGSDKVSFSAPSVAGQSTAIVDAMTMAGFDPLDIGYVEMHATGTPLGDPIEMGALAAAYRRLAEGPLPAGRIPVGSVKGNVGHTNTVAGMAGLLKLVLSLEHERIPPSINVTTVNPRLELENTPFVVNNRLRSWPRSDHRPRRAGVSSLGIGGTNVHLVLEEAPAGVRTPNLDRPRIVVWSGLDQAAAKSNQAALAGYFAGADEADFAGATSTLQRGRTERQVRGAAIAASAAEAAQLLSAGDVRTGEPSGEVAPAVVFTFPGQGSQYARMASELYGVWPTFTEVMDVCLEAVAKEGPDLYPLWLAESSGDQLAETAVAQPLLFAVEYALARQWMEWGITPAAGMGHSVGELVAATVAGVMDLEDALRLVTVRGQAMQRQPRGAMLVAATSPDQLPALPAGCAIAAVNASDQAVVAGPADALTQVAETLSSAGVLTRTLHTSHAFHSPSMRPAVAEFQAAFEGVDLAAPRLPVYSAATGKLLTPGEATDPGFWARQLAEPVLFDAAVGSASEAGAGILLEVGPGTALTGLVRRHPAVAGGRWRALASFPRSAAGEHRGVLETLADLWLAGCPVNWPSLYRIERPQRVSLPGYQFQRERHWVDPITGPAAPEPTVPAAGQAMPSAAPAAEAPAAAPAAGPFTIPLWTAVPGPASGEAKPGVALALVPVGDLRVVNALQQAGHEVIRVRPGAEFSERAGEYTVRPGHLAEDLGKVLHGSAQPSTLVHAWATGAPAGITEELDRTFYALLHLVQRAGHHRPSLLVVTSGAVDVSGSEPVNPVRAALIAAVRAFRLESPDTECRVIDLGSVVSEDQLIAELAADTAEPVVALRGTRRWLPGSVPWEATEPNGDLRIRRGGVYLLTGGLGGLGLAVAKGLAATGRRPTLVLVSRTIREVDFAEIESMGATVRVFSCDVADRDQLDTVLDQVGPVNGVFHLAGLPGDGMLQLRKPADAEKVLRPKVFGTLALDAAFADRPPLDFVVCFSSQAALTGMVGGADYSAANAFLDAYAATRPGWLSVNWPGWASVGMARGGVLAKLSAVVRDARTTGPRYETVLSAATHWELDEHRIGGAAVLPGTGMIDLIIRGYLEAVPNAAAPVTLRDVVFLRPLAGEAPLHTRVAFEPEGEAWRVRVLSRPEDTDTQAWQVHAEAVVVPGGPPQRSVAIAELTAGLTLTSLSAPSAKSAFVFGPRWHNLDEIWESGDTTVVRLALPAGLVAEAAAYAAHPALMDTGSGVIRRHRPGELLVPFTYRSMTWYAPLPGRLYSRLRSLVGDDPAADVEFITDDGAIVATIEGLRMRPAKVIDFSDQPDSVVDAEDADGLSPQEGVRLLLRLLASRTPAQVSVVPKDAGDSVPEPPVRALTTATATATEPVPAVVVAAETSVQERLAAIWCLVLGRSRVEPEDDFFELGGDSLMGVALTGRIRDAFGVNMSIGSLFDYPNLAALAGALEAQGAR